MLNPGPSIRNPTLCTVNINPETCVEIYSRHVYHDAAAAARGEAPTLVLVDARRPATTLQSAEQQGRSASHWTAPASSSPCSQSKVETASHWTVNASSAQGSESEAVAASHSSAIASSSQRSQSAATFAAEATAGWDRKVRRLPPLMLYADDQDGSGSYCDEIESFMRHLPPPGP